MNSKTSSEVRGAERSTTTLVAASFRPVGAAPLMLALVVAAVMICARMNAQAPFSSGSDGSDGALNLASQNAVDLSALNKDPDADGVYHFTTISMGQYSRLVVSGQKINWPVVFLAQGDVLLQYFARIDLSGQGGHPITNAPGSRLPSIPGPGGYSGGVGGITTPVSLAAQPGNGPGGGQAGDGGGTNIARSGAFTGNSFLVPLVGGSGGGGQKGTATYFGAGGGAGGGAILVASSTRISIAYGAGILADGGPAGDSSPAGSGSGSGGAIRLVAPIIEGAGFLSVPPGAASVPGGTFGRIRLEALQHLHNFSYVGLNVVTNRTMASPGSLFLGVPRPTLRVASIGGVAVPPNPAGSFAVPDVVINTGLPVTVNIEAQNIPAGTTVRLFVFSESGPDMIVDAPGLVQGTGGLLTTSVDVTFPTGYSRGFAKATFTQQF